MHYKDGTEAKVGDIVKGTGYNVKAADKTPKVIVGQVVGLTPGTDSCNIQVAHLVTIPLVRDHSTARRTPHQFYVEKGILSQDTTFGVVVDREYGQCDAFELVHRESIASV